MDIDPDDRQETEGQERQPSLAPPGRIEYRPETTMQTRAALVVQADKAAITKGGALVVVAGEAHVSMGGSWLTVARELNFDRGGSQWLIAGDARIQQGGAGIVVARQVNAADTRVGVLLAGSVNGDVQAVLDTEGAVRFGAAFGLVLGIALIIRRLMR